ncbi:cupin domain-containing protein [Paenibacillus sp. CC-CFT747]|nr:cupin domain-containing protein [Paenibacillus sp. CC-CFT747]
MEVRNFLEAELTPGVSHHGEGEVRSVRLYGGTDFATPLRFLYYTVIPPGTSIGYHRHKNDEEMYIILEGRGLMTMDGETREVKAGDAVLNRPFGSHGLKNHTEEDLRLLVFEVTQCPSANAGTGGPGA